MDDLGVQVTVVQDLDQPQIIFLYKENKNKCEQDSCLLIDSLMNFAEYACSYGNSKFSIF